MGEAPSHGFLFNKKALFKEIIGGLTTFSAMAYILAVHPSMMSIAGMDEKALFTTTAIISALATLAVGLWAKFPIAMAPGMGLNAFFVFTLCGEKQVPWQAGLAIVFCSGVLFAILSWSGIRRIIVSAFSIELRSGISAGIGAFLLFIGLQNAGLVVDSPATLVTGFPSLDAKLALLSVAIILGLWLVHKNIPGNILIVILVVAFVGLFIPSGEEGSKMTSLPEKFFATPASISPILFKFDFSFFQNHMALFIGSVLTFLLVDLFDTTGTLLGLGQRAQKLDKDGNWEEGEKAMKVDATATVIGAAMGTSPVTSYIESSAGIEAGARTGLASVVTALCFILSLWFSPIILSLPQESTAVALIVVGILMLQSLKHINFTDIKKYVPGMVCFLMIPLTFSISHGIALGYLSHVGLQIASGQIKNLSWIHWVLTLLFLVFLIL